MSFDKNSIDVGADPCTNFYQYACGNWQKANPIPPDKVRWGQFDLLRDRNDYLLYEELKSAAASPRTALQTKYGNYFAACMNVDLANQLGAKPIEPELAAIAGLKDKKQLAALDLDALNRFGGPMLFRVAVTQDTMDASKQILSTGQGGLTLPDRDYYVNQDERSKKIRDQYVAHMVKMFQLLGDTPEQAAAEAADVMRIETAMAQGSMSRVELRDPTKRYHIMKVDELQALVPSYDWKQYLAGLGFGAVPTLNVVSPGYDKTVNQIVADEPLPALQHYMRWHTLHGAAALLSDPFAMENFNFFQATLSGQLQQTPRWKRCTRATDGALGEAVGQDWVKQNFPPSAKARMEKLIDALDKSLAEDIKGLPWMSEATKQQAAAKLHAMERKIGYPEKWRDYSSLAVKRDDPVGNAERAELFERRRNYAKLGKPVDKMEWDMTPPTVNAYYDGSDVNINFPAGILQPPFFSEDVDPAVNFGGIGVVIGHEMTHAFDDQGAQFDLHGNLHNWFTKEDLDQFHERTKCVADEYSGFEVAPGQNLNGRLTLGENTADNGGLRIAFQALQETLAQQGAAAEPGYVDGKRDGYTPDQRYFLGFAQIWCENVREANARVLAKTDPHSSGEWRVNGSVQNFPEFGKAFGCKVGQPMMPVNACRVW
ncbi:MAG TPA: M13 family metallopeptidase [Acidobacteriaceae bacterium]|jgi:putative endopeptidase|nr:M13 family metallopeptidase [Acidobacteriaceae bacterium]